MPPSTEVDALLPLRPIVFSVLAVLRDGPIHGHGILERANRHLGRQALLGPGTLYRTLAELREQGLLEHAGIPDDEPEPDRRRSYYRLTDLGRLTVEAEARRLRGLMQDNDLPAGAPERA